MDQPPKIKPQLILYRSKRHTQIRQNNIKYGFYPYRVDFQESPGPSNPARRFFALSVKKYIHKITCTISSVKSCSLKIMPKTRTVKKLVLLLFSFKPDNQHLFQKMSKRIFKMYSKVIRLFLILMPESSDCALSLENTTLLSSLQHFSLCFPQFYYKHIRNLSTHLLPRNHQKRANFFDIYMLQTAKLAPLKKEIKKLALTSLTSEIRLRFLGFPDAKEKTITSFAQMFHNFPNLTTMDLTSPLDQKLLWFFENLQDNQHLKSFSLILTSSDKSSEIFELLPLALIGFKSLENLRIELNYFDYLNWPAFEGLEKCPKLTSLTLKFKECPHFDNSIHESLVSSLKNLVALKNLTIHMNSVSIDLAKILEIWAILGSFQDLQQFDLEFGNPVHKISHQEFEILCQSLKKLTNLTRLGLKISNSDLNDSAIIQLSKTISYSNKLENIELDFSKAQSPWILGNNVRNLAKSFENHKALSSLKLKITCLDLDDLNAQGIVLSLRSLKALDTLKLGLKVRDLDGNIEQFFKQNLESFQLKFDASIYYGKEEIK